MAETSLSAKGELVCQTIQALLINGGELPDKYVYKGEDTRRGATDALLPVLDLSVIDLGVLASSSPEGEAELKKLQSAFSSHGCIQAINHGIDSSFLDEMRDVAKLFFALPMEEKQKYARPVGDIEGYGNDPVLSENQTLDWNDRLFLTSSPEDQRKLHLWPQIPERFRGILQEHTLKVKKMNELILKAMARSLELEEHCFFKQCGERATMIARFTCYPPCPRPDLIMGCKPHSDGSAMTYLLQDKLVEGLQIMKDGHWFRVPIIPHALVINVGDQLEIMSNGVFKSPMHRAVTNSEQERISLAVFCTPEPEKEIGPVEKLITEERPRAFKNVKNYTSAYFEIYQKWKHPIDAMRI